MNCGMCGKEIKSDHYKYYTIYINVNGNNMSFGQEIFACSPSCLVDLAWDQVSPTGDN